MDARQRKISIASFLAFCSLLQTSGLPNIEDRSCPSGNFVRTFNQPASNLFTVVENINSPRQWNISTISDGCCILVDCALNDCEFSSCHLFNVTSCNRVDEISEAAVASTQVLDFVYDNASVEIIYQSKRFLKIENCSASKVNKNMNISSVYASYGETVSIKCHNQSQLVQGDILPPENSISLTCLECATWDNNETVYCVKANIQSQEVYIENTESNLNCSIDEPVPILYRETEFYQDNKIISQDKILTWLDHDSEVYCVIYLNNTNKSPIESSKHLLNIHYQPKQVQVEVSPTEGYVTTNDVTLLNTSQSVGISCSNVANPPDTQCTWNGITKSDCVVVELVTASTNFTCTATNSVGSNSSQVHQVVVVEKRLADITTTPQSGKVVEGNNLILICDIEYSHQLKTTYQWNLPNGSTFSSNVLGIVNVGRRDNGTYYCVTKDNFGIYSNLTYIDVLFHPYDVTMTTLENDNILQKEWEIYLNSFQKVTLNCSYEANPEGNCSFEISGQKISSDGLCSMKAMFNQSESVTCTVVNDVGKTTSQELQVIVVQPRIEVSNDLSPTNTQPIAGEDLTLNCSIPYQDELSTTFSWTIPSDRNINKTYPILQINDLVKRDLGNYVCTTIDVFGKTTRTKFIDVYYSPEKIGGQTTCHWSDVINGTCYLKFISNPEVEHFVVQKQEVIEPCPSCSLQLITGFIYTQQFTLLFENASEQRTLYQVHILSPNSLLQNLTVEFEVTVGDVINPPNQTGLIVGCVVGGVVLIALVIAMSVYFHRRKQESKKCEKPSHQPVISSNTANIVGGFKKLQLPVTNPNNKDQDKVQQTTDYVDMSFNKQAKEHAYETSACGIYETPLKEEHKYAEIK